MHEALAINGTVTPEDDEVGIPRRWMDATAESLLQGGWPKFVRRMCLDKSARQDFQAHAPERDLAGAIDELEVLRTGNTRGLRFHPSTDRSERPDHLAPRTKNVVGAIRRTGAIDSRPPLSFPPLEHVGRAAG